MRGRIFLVLFALPFVCVGAFAGYSVLGTLADGWRARNWQTVDATVVDGGTRSHSGDDSTTYEAFARYRYRVAGRDYVGNRVGLDSGTDNIGGWQTRTGERLARSKATGRPIVVWYDPASPADAVVDRRVRWGMVGFKSLFFLVFGGVGAGLLFAAIRRPSRAAGEAAAGGVSPWLTNPDWQKAGIASSSRKTMIGTWLIAAFWNLVSAPLPFLLVDEVLGKQNYLALVGLVFPLAGMGLLLWAVRRTREWLRFGAAPVVLDPFPGAIGGHVGGHIDLALPFEASRRFEVTLTSLGSRVSGSGKSRSRRETAEWQTDQVAHAEPGPRGTRLLFRFDVPGGLTASDASKQGDSWQSWRLNVRAELPGADFNRDYELPVYPTAARSARLCERDLEAASVRQDAFDDADVRRIVDLDYAAGTPRLHYPAGRYLGSGLAGVAIGGVFAAAGVFLVTSAGEWLFGLVFGGVGLLIAVSMLFLVLNSLTVSREGANLVAVRRVLGLPVWRRQLVADRIRRLSRDSKMQMQSGGRHVLYYSVYAHDDVGDRITVGGGFRGEGDADAAIRLITSAFGLRLQGVPASGGVDRIDDLDVLAADR